MYLPGSQTPLDGFSERKVRVPVRIAPWKVDDGDRSSVPWKTAGRTESASVPEPDLGINRNNHVLSTNTVEAQGLHGEIFIVSVYLLSRHISLVFFPTSKCLISLWASGINRKKFFPNDSLLPKDHVRSPVDSDIMTPCLGSQLLP